MFAGVGDAVMPSRASAVDDGFDFVGILVTSSPQKLQVEVAAIKSPQHRHSGMFVEDNDDDDDDDNDDDGDDNAGNENGMLTVLLPSMI